MECTIRLTKGQQWWGEIGHTVAVMGLMILIGTGTGLESIGGWVANPPTVIQWGEGGKHSRGCRGGGLSWRVGWEWVQRSWVVAAVRSEGLMLLVYVSERQEWGWVCLLPWTVWVWKGIGIAWPGLGRQPLYEGLGRVWEQASRVTLIGLGMVWLGEGVSRFGEYSIGVVSVGMCLPNERSWPYVEVEKDEVGGYYAQIGGEFEIYVDGNVEMYRRLLVIFLGLL